MHFVGSFGDIVKQFEYYYCNIDIGEDVATVVNAVGNDDDVDDDVDAALG